MTADLWNFDQVEMLALHSGEVVGGPLDVMREPDGTVYGFRFQVGDRRVIHVAAVKISTPIPRLVIPFRPDLAGTGDFDGNGWHFTLNGKLVSREEWLTALK